MIFWPQTLLILITFSLFVGGCTTRLDRREIAQSSGATAIAALRSAGFEEAKKPGQAFRLWYRPIGASEASDSHSEPISRIVVVFESDGAAWRAGGWEPPRSPTPQRPVGAMLAAALSRLHSGPVVYVGRHCQFLEGFLPAEHVECKTNRLWTSGRFSKKVVAELRNALQELSFRPAGHRQPPEWVLTGYSGGGTIAALIASELSNVSCLITFAAPLDLDAWVYMHRITPLYESVSPSWGAAMEQIRRVPRVAFWFGEEDLTVPIRAAGAFLDSEIFGVAVKVLPRAGHVVTAGWQLMMPRAVVQTCLSDNTGEISKATLE
jgi:hypothetical protein